jgi:hypothetical protein
MKQKRMPDRACFPTLWPLLQSIHCEMHMYLCCFFERNEQPSVEYDDELSRPPPHWKDVKKCLFGDEEPVI